MAAYTALIVDDEVEFASTLAERLCLRGVDAAVANDGFSALEYINAHRPHVVVVDCVMPGLNGLDVLKEVKRKHPEIQVILLSGRGTTHNAMMAMRLGAFDYLLKPVMLEDLFKRMNEAYQIYPATIKD